MVMGRIGARPTRSLARLLTGAVVALVAYASLYPFGPWRWPPGMDLIDLLALPWAPWRDLFDEVSNVLGYVPMAMLLFVSLVRRDVGPGPAMGAALLLSSLLSYGMETLQHFLPMRVPSLRDWTCNTLGALLGVLLARALLALGWLDQWRTLRDRWFLRGRSVGLALLLLWPALLFPAPLPFGLGQCWDEAVVWLNTWLAGSLPQREQAFGLPPSLNGLPRGPLQPLTEAAAIALGLFAPISLMGVVSAPGWRRIPMALAIVVTGLAATTLSTALNFSPTQSLAWISPLTLGAVLAACGTSLLMVPLAPRLCAGLGLMGLVALVLLVAHAPADPYYAASLQAWEQGRFIRFHGMAQWVGWVWPYAVLLWLLTQLSAAGSLKSGR